MDPCKRSKNWSMCWATIIQPLLACTTFQDIKIGKLWVVLYTGLKGLFIGPIRIPFFAYPSEKIYAAVHSFKWRTEMVNDISSTFYWENTKIMHARDFQCTFWVMHVSVQCNMLSEKIAIKKQIPMAGDLMCLDTKSQVCLVTNWERKDLQSHGSAV